MLKRLAALCWGPWTLGLFLLVGCYYTWAGRGFQLRRLPLWLGKTLGRLKPRNAETEKSPLETLSTALAATIGTGSIAGVAAAISIGGAGALFWMEVAALLGMMTGWAEKALSVSVRRPWGKSWLGGPMIWLEEKGFPGWATLFAWCSVLCALGMGGVVQANSITSGIHQAFGWNRLVVGVVVALCAGLALRGGGNRVGKVCQGLVPLMALVFLGISVGALVKWRAELPEAVRAVWQGAFSSSAITGGGVGTVIRCGVARSVFTSEAGLGTTAMIHAGAKGQAPFQEGLWGILEVFLSTVVVCTLTGLVLIACPRAFPGAEGAAWTAAVFGEALGEVGPRLLVLCLTLFAFSSILGASQYGRMALDYLGRKRVSRWYVPVLLCCVLAGAVAEVSQVWELADICTGLMAWPSLTALLLYRKKLTKILREGERNLFN
jgi:AGCS family alanine or glycine:cation symporter